MEDQDLEQLTIPQLKSHLKAKGLKVGGRKDELIKRLREHRSAFSSAGATSGTSTSILGGQSTKESDDTSSESGSSEWREYVAEEMSDDQISDAPPHRKRIRTSSPSFALSPFSPNSAQAQLLLHEALSNSNMISYAHQERDESHSMTLGSSSDLHPPRQKRKIKSSPPSSYTRPSHKAPSSNQGSSHKTSIRVTHRSIALIRTQPHLIQYETPPFPSTSYRCTPLSISESNEDEEVL